MKLILVGLESLLPRGEAQQRRGVFPFPLMTFSLGSLVVVAGRARGQPGGHGPGAGLLGHAVVADDGVEPAPGVGILCRVIGVQRGGDAALVLGGERDREKQSEDFSGAAVCTHSDAAASRCPGNAPSPAWLSKPVAIGNPDGSGSQGWQRGCQ